MYGVHALMSEKYPIKAAKLIPLKDRRDKYQEYGNQPNLMYLDDKINSG